MSAAGEALMDIVRAYAGIRTALFLDTRLYHDLFIGGDDASELLEDIRSRFGTNFDGLIFDRYFPGETECGVLWLLACFGYKSARWQPLTFGHLLAVVNGGKWFDPPG